MTDSENVRYVVWSTK